MDTTGQYEGTEHRHERERQNERAAKAKHNGHRHWMKHFSFNAGKRENRDINNRDDEHTKEHGISYFLAGLENSVQAFLDCELASQVMLSEAKLPNNVFYD